MFTSRTTSPLAARKHQTKLCQQKSLGSPRTTTTSCQVKSQDNADSFFWLPRIYSWWPDSEL